jgi:hypothetical protein
MVTLSKRRLETGAHGRILRMKSSGRCLAMAEPLRVVSEHLHVSAATVDAHADSMRARHVVSDGRIESSQPGLPASAALAMSAAVSKWQAEGSALYGQLVDHGHGLRSGAAAYHLTDQQSAAEVEAAGRKAAELNLGL